MTMFPVPSDEELAKLCDELHVSTPLRGIWIDGYKAGHLDVAKQVPRIVKNARSDGGVSELRRTARWLRDSTGRIRRLLLHGDSPLVGAEWLERRADMLELEEKIRRDARAARMLEEEIRR